MRRLRFRLRTLLIVVAIVAAFLATFNAGRRYPSTPRLQTIRAANPGVRGAGVIRTYKFDMKDPEGAAAFRRTVEILKASKEEYTIE
jgi:hypothetical protein